MSESGKLKISALEGAITSTSFMIYDSNDVNLIAWYVKSFFVLFYPLDIPKGIK